MSSVFLTSLAQKGALEGNDLALTSSNTPTLVKKSLLQRFFRSFSGNNSQMSVNVSKAVLTACLDQKTLQSFSAIDLDQIIANLNKARAQLTQKNPDCQKNIDQALVSVEKAKTSILKQAASKSRATFLLNAFRSVFGSPAPKSESVKKEEETSKRQVKEIRTAYESKLKDAKSLRDTGARLRDPALKKQLSAQSNALVQQADREYNLGMSILAGKSPRVAVNHVSGVKAPKASSSFKASINQNEDAPKGFFARLSFAMLDLDRIR